ncbi:MAG: large subunit ribosomal protein L10 [Rubritalea sp.]|jgi:large subunit ribosomal protein L10|tara:strand:+ start:2177 stop:2671 length:495 start_codon:yes stop_codon:yes gene_type:complete
MNPDKKIIIDELLERVNGSPYVLVMDYTGVTVTQFSELRDNLREGGAECHVAKNTYMKAALSEAGLPDISSELIGQTAFVTGDGEVTAAAKAVKEFAKKATNVKLKIGILDGEVIDEEKINVLASLPSRDELLAKLLSVINEPGTSILRALNEKHGNTSSDEEE